MTITVDAEDKAILRFLAGLTGYSFYDSYCNEYSYASFDLIREESTDELKYTMEWKLVRRHCRKLARKGLLEYGKGLWNDEGPAGSGYRITKNGVALLELLEKAEPVGKYEEMA